MVVKDVEREDIEFICKGLGCKPIASLDHFTADMLGSAELAEEMHAGSSKIVKVNTALTELLLQLVLSNKSTDLHPCLGEEIITTCVYNFTSQDESCNFLSLISHVNFLINKGLHTCFPERTRSVRCHHDNMYTLL